MASVFVGCNPEGEDKTSDNKIVIVPNENIPANFKIGVIHIGDPADGSGYSYAHDQGIVGMQIALGIPDSKVIRKLNVDDQDAAAIRIAVEDCIAQGCKIIFGTSFGYQDTMLSLANEPANAGIIFSHGTGYKNNDINMNNYFGRIYQARYLAGIAAGLKT
ncbi:MAG: BMP family ABC transporter substrate-binding protein, partial [Clostridia bacterium]|nr:BMP family ABC transporter substrate-binding protein [Clostridia bacterium]